MKNFIFQSKKFRYFQKTIKTMLYLFSKRKFSFVELSNNIFFSLEYYLQLIFKNTLKYMIRGKRTIVTVEDLRSSVSEIKEINLIIFKKIFYKKPIKHLNFLTKKIRKIKILAKNKNYKFKNNQLYLIQNWFNISKNKNFKKKKKIQNVVLSKFFFKNSDNNSNLKSLSLSLLTNKQKLFYRYFIIILEKEDKDEIDFFEEEAFLECLSSDKGLHSLIPYIIIYLNNFILREKDSFLKILLAYKIIKALFLNTFLKLEPFLHQILPILLKGIISTLAEDILLDDILSLKLFLANLLNYIVNRFEKNNINLKSKLSFFFLKHFLYYDENMLLLYGALLGLTSLGNKIIELYVIPNLTIILFEIEKKKKEI
jgi:hypothetical protein